MIIIIIIITIGQVIDATRMSLSALTNFFEAELQDCKAKGLMVSLHLKVTQSFFLFWASCLIIPFQRPP